ncbi:hypothetical protein SAMD00019534_092170 [Acytostelium subglobosum LB1]|uniref:hypothetical protein n=1 Tax=Acytostelium subglobosum LB1 TaxID=1410327 RepID=UPI000644F818|nr:hypothetical protein SAMD00019534_092170 [Acytostelium subglobosum LB1]GAM26042.1 hypothetical protein SAMD00019534_092170 [Acytostelium subglobosum LB1]|eukprot:XP_012751085.1 hypothetical protein SAMD00019534_092170 [Acytostelium subglobosum LB1]
MASFLNRVKHYFSQGRLAVGSEVFFDTNYRYPAPGSQTPPDVTNKQPLKTRPMSKVYKYLKKRGEVQHMRPAQAFADATDAEEQYAKEYYEKEPYPVSKTHILNTAQLFKAVNADYGFDIRNINNFTKHQNKIEIPGGLSADHMVFTYQEYHIDTFEHLPKKVESSF